MARKILVFNLSKSHKITNKKDQTMLKSLTLSLISLFFFIPVDSVCGAQVGQLKSKNITVLCRGSITKTVNFNGQKILQDINLHPLSFKAGPSSVARSSKVDLWFLSLSGKINKDNKAILDYSGQIALPTNNSFEYNVSGTFHNDIDLKRDLLIYSWIDYELLKGCRFEYYYKKSWHKGIMPTSSTSFSKSGIKILKVFLSNGKTIIFSALRGNLRIMRWKSKIANQPFRFDVYNPSVKSFKKGDKFELAFTMKIITQKTASVKSKLSRKPLTASLFQSKANSDVITLDMKQLKDKLNFNGLSTIKLQDASGKKLISQIEDRNLNGVIDIADVLVFKAKLNKRVWHGITLTPIYSDSGIKPSFESVNSNSYSKDKIVFSQISPALYKIGFSNNTTINVRVGLRDGLKMPANQGTEYLRQGIYASEGPIRTRISVVLKAKSGLPSIRSFIFNQNNQTVTYASATMSYLGWGKHYLNIKTPKKYNNAGYIIAYAFSQVNFLPLGAKIGSGTYGDWLSGWYLKDYTGITIGRLNERQSFSAWAPNAYVSSKGLGFFYPTGASSFTGKAQISFINDKVGFTKALNRCKSFSSWDFISNASTLNKKLVDADKSIIEIYKKRKVLINQLKDLTTAGLYTASLKTKLEMAQVYIRTAKQAFELGRPNRYIERIKKAKATLAECLIAINIVKNKQLKLPLPPVKTKSYIGVCMGRVSQDTSKTDFKGMFCDPQLYAPLKTVGLKDVQYHSFAWGNKIKPIIEWCNMLKSLGLRPWPQMNMQKMPKKLSPKYPYYRKWRGSYHQCYVGRPFSPEYMKDFKQTDSLAKEIKQYFKNAASKLNASGVGGFFATNEPTPHNIEYTGEMKEAFLYGFRNYLRKKYKNVTMLNTAWNSNYSGLSSVKWNNEWLTEKSKDVISLNGEWLFKVDSNNIGIKQAWNKNIPSKTVAIKVPGSWEKQIAELKAYDGIAWYFKKLTLPRGKYNIKFTAVDDNATVYFKGQKLFRNIGYNKPFVVNISSSGKAEWLVLRVEDTKGGGGIYRSVQATTDSTFPWASPLAYPARCADYYDYRHHVIGDYVNLQTTAMESGAPGKIIAVKEWTSCLEDNRFKNYCDPFIKVKADKGGYIGWDQYGTQNDFWAFQAALRQSSGNNRPSIIGEYGLNGGGNSGCPTGSAAVQYAENRTYRLLGRNVRGFFFFAYSNNHTCGLLDQDGCIPDRLINMGKFARSVFNLKGVFDSLLPFGEIGIYFSRNDAYMSSKNMAYNQVFSLFKMFYLNNLNPAIVDSITMPEKMKKLKLLIVPSAPFISDHEWQMIMQFRKNGGTVLIYANTGLMNVNNTKRVDKLLQNTSYSGRETIKFMGVTLSKYTTLGMTLQKLKPVWRSLAGKPLLGKNGKRLYISNLDIGNLYIDNNEKIRKYIWETISGILKEAGAQVYVVSKHQVQYLENNSGDVFIFIPGQGKEIKNLKLKVDVSNLKQVVQNDIIYDYLNLKKASVTRKGHHLYIKLDKHEKRENAIWWIGRK
jgi:hypothetical protein